MRHAGYVGALAIALALCGTSGALCGTIVLNPTDLADTVRAVLDGEVVR